SRRGARRKQPRATSREPRPLARPATTNTRRSTRPKCATGPSRNSVVLPIQRALVSTQARVGRPKGRFTQHLRLDKLRHLMEQHSKGMTVYELADSIGVTPRSMRRYLKEVSSALELEPVPTRGGGAKRWRIRSGELPRKIELRRTQAYAILAARRLFEPMKGS